MQIFCRLGAFAIILLISRTSGLHSDYVRLHDSLVESANKDVLPITAKDTPVNVGIRLTLSNIIKADTLTKVVDMSTYIMFSWNSTLKWDPSEFNGISSIRVPRNRLWVPDITLYNGVGPFENEAPDIALVYHNGAAYWGPKFTLRALCDVDEDKLASNATCSLRFGSWTYDGFHLTLKDTDSSSIDVTTYFTGSSYSIVSVSSEKKVEYYSCCPEPFPDITFNITFVKKSQV